MTTFRQKCITPEKTEKKLWERREPLTIFRVELRYTRKCIFWKQRKKRVKK